MLLIFLLANFSMHGLTIKLGSLAPANTPWDKYIHQIGSDWEKASAGKVVLKIYPGGVVGDETVMLRKIRLGQLDAAAITSVGMNQIYQGVLAFSIPMFITKNDELSYAIEKIGPYFEAAMEKKSFKVIVWTFAGWTHLFSRHPAPKPDDLKTQKLWVWEGNSRELQLWKEGGFHPVPLAAPDMMTSLQSGMVDAFIATPASAASYQWFASANYMCEMNWAPLVAGLVISSAVWAKIPPELQPVLLDIAHKTGPVISEESNKLDAEAVRIMKENGLKTYPVTKENISDWKSTVDKYFDKYIETEIGRDTYDKVNAVITDYRKNAKQK
jgi:TRAP-type C4-dicarboxylate transport system substrate-binding protein